MAEETKTEPDEGSTDGEPEVEPKKSRGTLKLLGAVVGLIGAGTALALVAMPSKPAVKKLEGPSLHILFAAGEFVGNPLDDNYSRYLKFKPSCSFLAYDLTYPEMRRTDPHYETLLRELMQHTVSKFEISQVMGGANKDQFAAALEEVAEPVIFPVHIGETVSPYDSDPESGLRVGDSQERRGTFRGPFWECVLHVNGVEKTLQIDEGPVHTFSGAEYDMLVEAEDGSALFVDVSALKEEFVGDVHVGVMGRVRRMFTGDIIAQ